MFTIIVTFTDLDATGQVDTTGAHNILIRLGSGLTESFTSIPAGGADADGVFTFSTTRSYLDNRIADLTVTVTDDDVPTFHTSDTFHVAVTVNNVAPTATLASGGPVNEGSPVTVSFSGAFDPSPTDTKAGFHYSFACDGQDGSLAANYLAAGAASSTSCPFNDNGSFTVKGRIFDKDDGSNTYPVTVTVNNVAPTATISNGGPVNEASSVTIGLSGASDPSSADTLAGFHYAFDCSGGSLAAATYAASGTSASTSCTYDDGPSSRTASARILDKDGGFTDYTTTVAVNNVAPTATFNAPSVNEGSPIALSLTSPSDPSSADTLAGFQYAFDCGDGAGYGAFGSSNTSSCATTDNGTRAVRGKLQDKDGGSTEYTTTVTVNNVAPTATFNAPASVNEGSPIVLSLTSPSDPSPADTLAGFQYAFDCGDGSGYGAFGSSNTLSCASGPSGVRTVRGKIADKDGGSSEYTATVTVNSVAPDADKLFDELVTLVHSWNVDAMAGKVDQARSQFASGDKDGACSSLKALSNMVSAQTEKKVPMDQVEAFGSLVNKLSAAIPCTDLKIDSAAPKEPTQHH
ncbi:MAG TPA: hypothetical protein VGR46_05800 [Candidatus Limnocylindria bacterium]|nr:hypothetical protein [Candidatus Limnocylindria bacterium]